MAFDAAAFAKAWKVTTMAYFVFGGSNIVNAGNAFTLANGDELQTLAGSVLASTTGSGIFAAGAVTIEVAGTVGGLQNGIYDNVASGNSSTITIDRTGSVFSGASQSGIAIDGAGTHTIVNSGAVTSTGSDGWGVVVVGGGLIVNQAGGTITAGMGIRSQDTNAADFNEIVNYGVILGSENSFYGFGADQVVLANQGAMIGALVMSANAADLLYNVGTMDATNANNFMGFNVRDSAVVNVGLMYQVVAGSTTTTMIKTGNGVGDYVYNIGTLAEVLGPGGSAASAAIVLGDGGGDYVYNSGVIYGNVALGNGAGDAYLGGKGTIAGTITCGSGGDRVDTGADIEIVKAGAGNDTFNIGTGGETILQEKAAQQLSNGFDLVSNFQSYDPATKLGTFLQIDASLQATTGFTSDGAGGTYVYMGLGGGAYSYIDVLGASVAEVEAQTYFA
jgi:hypothetical protein